MYLGRDVTPHTVLLSLHSQENIAKAVKKCGNLTAHFSRSVMSCLAGIETFWA